ncbi:hypothetical protein BNJ_00005 [Kaumoebavirus]|uniref:hypothetical protein n=1 Tax=Kaumoebavirus TaxID=1859492 RepID=UPI0009C24348|nr:hypothetical protein BNJ_00005 [Kaumoebavirus]ARA71852.1 hypothetical protein BNJ_00005 [Kaumoebavirus]
MLSSELRRFLGRELCKDVVGIIEEYVAGQARRVSRIITDNIENVEWEGIYTPHWYEKDRIGIRIRYMNGTYREVVRCSDCWSLRLVRGINFIESREICVSWSKCKEKNKGIVRTVIHDDRITLSIDEEPYVTVKGDGMRVWAPFAVMRLLDNL